MSRAMRLCTINRLSTRTRRWLKGDDSTSSSAASPEELAVLPFQNSDANSELGREMGESLDLDSFSTLEYPLSEPIVPSALSSDTSFAFSLVSSSSMMMMRVLFVVVGIQHVLSNTVA